MNRIRCPKAPKGELENAKWPFFCIKVHLSRKMSMLLVFWHRQRLVQSIVLHFGQNWPTLQRGLSAIAELLVIMCLTNSNTPCTTPLSRFARKYSKMPTLVQWIFSLKKRLSHTRSRRENHTDQNRKQLVVQHRIKCFIKVNVGHSYWVTILFDYHPIIQTFQ